MLRCSTLLSLLASVILLAPGCDPKGSAGAIGGSSRADDKDGVKGELARPRPERVRPEVDVAPTLPPKIDPSQIEPLHDPVVTPKTPAPVETGGAPLPTP